MWEQEDVDAAAAWLVSLSFGWAPVSLRSGSGLRNQLQTFLLVKRDFLEEVASELRVSMKQIKKRGKDILDRGSPRS